MGNGEVHGGGVTILSEEFAPKGVYNLVGRVNFKGRQKRCTEVGSPPRWGYQLVGEVYPQGSQKKCTE